MKPITYYEALALYEVNYRPFSFIDHNLPFRQHRTMMWFGVSVACGGVEVTSSGLKLSLTEIEAEV